MRVCARNLAIVVLCVASACGDEGPSVSTEDGGGSTMGTTAVGDDSTGPGDPSTGDGSTQTTTTDPSTSSGSSESDSGEPVDPCDSALLCDDFEGFAPTQAPGWPWTVSEDRGTVVVDEQRAFSGTRSVRFTTEAGEGTFRRAYMSVVGDPVFPVDGNVVWGRMMIWLTAAPDGSIHWTNIQGEGPVEGMDHRAYYRYGGQHDKRWMANYETEMVSSDCWQHSQTAIPEGAWACVEWQFDGPQNAMRLWVDGVELEDIHVVGSGEGCVGNDTAGQWLAPMFDTMRLGWEHYQQSAIAHELWIDDVALDESRIGCPSR